MTTIAKPLSGLTEDEARTRHAQGQGNAAKIQNSRSYREIIYANVFTFINLLLFAIGAVLVGLGLYTDAWLSVGIALLNAVVGMVQELRAKHALDRIALLTRPRATVLRQGQERVIDPSEIVLGDTLVVRPGDQIVVDGQVIGEGKIDVDESLLTGESDLITKIVGDAVLSGSFVVNGSAAYKAEKVGSESFANQLTASARAYKYIKTPLQQDVELIVRILVLLSIQLAVLFVIYALVNVIALTEGARIASVITGLIPNGMFFMISVAYAMGAIRMAGEGALIQQANAVESMSHVNVICLDKTGTLTANRIHLKAVEPFAMSEAVLRQQLGDFAASVTATNRTSEALGQACPGQRRALLDEVPFSSARKWSAISVDEPSLRGVFVFGAPEILRLYLASVPETLEPLLHKWQEEGLRVLLFAHSAEPTPLHDEKNNIQLPNRLTALGLLTFSDELRPEAGLTLQSFRDTGIQLKIISGDNPNTVAALARQAGFVGEIPVISGPEIEELTTAELADIAERTTIFGRITPQQKERLVTALEVRGHYVAMVGDGVNDVLSLKKAHIGIAMQSGTQAARGVADIILMNDSFGALPPAFREGQRIINGMQDILRLFVARAVYQTLSIIGVSMLGFGFPITPVHQSLLTMLTVGIPMFFMAAWARPAIPRQRLITAIIRFVLPAGFSLAFLGLVMFTIYHTLTFHATLKRELTLDPNMPIQQSQDIVRERGPQIREQMQQAEEQALAIARTVLNTVSIFGGLMLIIFVEPPTSFWTGGDDYSGDWRPTNLAVLMGLCYLLILIVPGLRDFFQLETLYLHDYAIIAAAVAVWALVLRWFWRRDLLSYFLRLSPT